MEKLEGRKAVLAMNIPGLNTKITNKIRPTFIPNSRQTLLSSQRNFIKIEGQILWKRKQLTDLLIEINFSDSADDC